MNDFKITSINPDCSYIIEGDVLQKMLGMTAIYAVEAYIARQNPLEDRILKTNEAMEYLGIKSRATLDRYQNQKGNKLKYIPGSPKRFYESDLKEFLAKNKIG
ncbi:helix-turn-helix domain-containing protein [Pontibacter populi]|uniref:Helix-turn-helix domain-containing protein n=1 Tax=Pontibacter populi TaxID=890055 RepID=A0ABV1RP53_9BACT